MPVPVAPSRVAQLRYGWDAAMTERDAGTHYNTGICTTSSVFHSVPKAKPEPGNGRHWLRVTRNEYLPITESSNRWERLLTESRTRAPASGTNPEGP
jgi:hypothetical protein